ncbi:hypothetical protein EDC18_10119 [Natranaerovirga pectinivora]|uniref:DUF6199 domain-containing protein n=1 Tax=Natranaerovirga pectinivora TaxID=682400 RepID=A0A4R3MPM1_9FIRM|nr:DUF6199 family natural product biosynthesis protein [Natranaerovirga pectinivora]TCT16724.1 hypothetical protein EDC18_10119 [Natranaerovirga pectinivora]
MKKRLLLMIFVILILSSCYGRGNNNIQYRGRTYGLEKVTNNSYVFKSSSGGGAITINTFDRSSSMKRYDVYIGSNVYILNGDTNRINVIYPNGQKTFAMRNGGAGKLVEGYPWPIDFMHLIISFEEMINRPKTNNEHFFYGIIFIGIGIYSYKNPELGWYLKHGWKYRNAEPSDFYIAGIKVLCVILVLIGLFLFINGLGII